MNTPTSLTNHTIGRYRIGDEIGRGGMGIVYRAHDTALGRSVAFKVLLPQYANDPRVTRDFIGEAQKVGRLSDHAGIVKIFDVGQYQGRAYFVMDLVDGVPLEKLLQEQPMSLPRAVRIIGQVASALHHAHRHGLVHRDVKPANIIISAGDRATLTDFSVARSFRDAYMTHIGQGGLVGTPPYMSPEQFGDNPNHIRPPSDTYSLGVTAFQMLTGRLPFRGENVFAIINAHLRTRPPKPSSVNPALSPMLDRVILKALEKKPRDRYATTIDFANELATAANLSMRIPTQRPPISRGVLAALVAVAALLLIVGVAAFANMQAPDPGDPESSALPGNASSGETGATQPDENGAGVPDLLGSEGSPTDTNPAGVLDSIAGVLFPTDTPRPAPTEEPPSVSLSTPTRPMPAADRAVPPPAAAGVMLRSPSAGGTFDNCVTFNWDGPADAEYDLKLCHGVGCEPSQGIYSGKPPYAWAPTITLAGRADLADKTGTFRWRVLNTRANIGSDIREFTWRGGQCP